MRVIDADKLVDMLYDNEFATLCPLDEVSGVVDSCPTIDAVVVTHCKDCKYYDRGECYHPRHERHLQSICQEDDDFCSYGERKDCGDADR